MRPTGPQPAETTETRPRALEQRHAFARRIDCGGDGYAAESAAPTRGDEMRAPDGWLTRRGDP